ncbi:c-type cytochrome [Deinococcus sp.]|uniref:c-type cytochrome n=1 Tax=Deinococcus sp. TaxID=47478 RepID=UPI003CC5E584
MTKSAAILALLLTGSTLAAANLKHGMTIYSANCASCHGAKAQGGVGPSLHEASGWTPALFQRALLKYVDDKGVPLKAPMPNWGKVGFAGDHGKPPTISELTDLQAYLKTLK